MEPDPASLDNLRGLAEPPPVSWWPLAPGWWVLFGILVALAAFISVKCWLSWRGNAYRRAALRELEGADGIAAVAELLKRTALVAYPRDEVAPLTGDRWCDWLESKGRGEMPGPVREALVGGVFGSGEFKLEPVSEFAASWIARHDGSGSGEGGRAC